MEGHMTLLLKKSDRGWDSKKSGGTDGAYLTETEKESPSFFS